MFTYNSSSINNKLVVGNIYMRYKENNSINFTNAMPTNNYVANQYFEFQIIGKNTNTTKDIIYDIVLAYGDNHETRNTRIRDDLLKFRLVTVANNVETEIFTDQSYSSINNKRIHATTIPKNTTNEITTTYRLYAWISNDTLIGNVAGADYSSSEWDDVYASVKVSVTGDFNEKVRYDQETYGSNANNIKNTNTPILTCSRPVDRLTVSNGNLTYPIGLLTYDELALAGAKWSAGNSNYYLYTNQFYWLLSPFNFNGGGANMGFANSGLSDYNVDGGSGVRPALSLKLGTQILRGEGSKTKPYIITED